MSVAVSAEINDLKEAVSLLQQTGTPVLGCIVNKAVASRISKTRYSYYYGGKNEYQKHGPKTEGFPARLRKGTDRRA